MHTRSVDDVNDVSHARMKMMKAKHLPAEIRLRRGFALYTKSERYNIPPSSHESFRLIVQNNNRPSAFIVLSIDFSFTN